MRTHSQYDLELGFVPWQSGFGPHILCHVLQINVRLEGLYGKPLPILRTTESQKRGAGEQSQDTGYHLPIL